MLELININQLDKFKLDSGDLFKGININEDDYKEFGELYFSFINFQSIKAWKRHTKMHMNLFVPVGDVKFVFFVNNHSILEKLKLVKITIIGYQCHQQSGLV